MSRQTGWEKIDSDLWRLRESRDQAIVIVKKDKRRVENRDNWWTGIVDIKDGDTEGVVTRYFPLNPKGREEAKAWVEKVWAVLGGGK